MTDKIKTGSKGEDLAASFLVSKGYQIVERNYRYRHSEIDLIVRKDAFLVFVEVKARKSTRFGEPEQFVSAHQEAKIRQGAEAFIFNTDWKGPIRFDIVSIVLGSPVTITHFEDAIQ